jgi:hypothetical protein
MSNDNHRCPSLGEMAIMAEDMIEHLEKQNRSLIDQLRAAENQIIAYKEVFKVIRQERIEEEVERAERRRS